MGMLLHRHIVAQREKAELETAEAVKTAEVETVEENTEVETKEPVKAKKSVTTAKRPRKTAKKK